MTTTTDRHLDLSTEQLLDEYLAVCNRALREAAGRFWLRQAKRVNRAVWGEANFRTLVYDGSPENVIGEFTIHFDADRRELSRLPLNDHDIAFTWRVPLRYLRDVVDRADWYVENPAMLDWRWVGARVRDEVTNRARNPRAVAMGAGGFVLGAATGVLSCYYVTRR